ncbi:MAG: PDZ domain-containing protein [Deltaproteobacteria bacterium]|nr:PDZ domain-containing protein [Deltaproteobacteria bacterium]
MLRVLCLLIAWSAFYGPVAEAAEALLPRHPAPSPDGSEIAFSWQGDLWKVAAEGGVAARLTAHPAADRFPIWSDDGRWIAFSSDRHGNPDIFVLATDGSSPPRRLTHASVEDRPIDFDPQGENVIFTSRRDESFRRSSNFYSVPLAGGTPHLALPILGLSGSWSPDGATFALVRGSTRWTRRGYRGAANRDLWLWRSPDDILQITDFDGDDDRPNWISDGSLVFLSSRPGRKNLFRLDLATGDIRQITSHQGSDVRMPRSSADGRLLAYEFEDGLWTLSTNGGQPQRLAIEVPADGISNAIEHREDRDGAQELVVHPNGKLVAFTLHGDVFLSALADKEELDIAPPPTWRLTRTPQQETGIQWSPDGEALLLSSQREGAGDLYLLRRQDEEIPWTESFEFSWKRLTSSSQADHSPQFSPDGKRVAFLRGRGHLMTVTTEGDDEVTLLDHWFDVQFAWSPDSQWLTYSTPDSSFNSDVWIVPASGGQPYNVSRHPDDDDSPTFSADGKRLLWISHRRADTADLWSVWLSREDHERTKEDWVKHFKATRAAQMMKMSMTSEEDGKPTGPGKPQEEIPKLPPVEVTIDLDRLWQRAQAVTELKGNEGDPLSSSDGQRLFFTSEHEGERDLYSVRWDGGKLNRLTEGDTQPTSIQSSRDGKTLFFLDSKGKIKRIDQEGKAGDPIPFAARYEIDQRLEAKVVFDEVWQALADNFYDPDFHGVDWSAEKERYRPWALAASHPRDFSDVMNLLLGELNASHMGYGQPPTPGGEETGWIGALFDAAAGGPGLLVREVLPDSPAARVSVDLKPGERLVAVQGEAVEPDTNVYALLRDTVGQKVRLRIQNLKGEARDAIVIPTSRREIGQLRYSQWTRQRQAIVDRESDGRLGYLHIQGMNIPSFEEFEHSLYAAGEGKEGLVIDVRSNGGGWTTDYLMAVLSVRRHARTVARGADPQVKAYPQGRLPLAAWTKPAVALCDQDSYSNAEIFSHAFKNLDRGPLVGTPTFGAVISTGGTSLINGGFVRLPFRGWYVAKDDLNMELNGAIPDVLVEFPPEEDLSPTADTQLEKSVQVLLSGLKEDPRYGAW